MTEEMDLAAELKSLGVTSLVINTTNDGVNYPYSGKQMVVAKDRLCQHIDLRAKTLEDFLQTARGFWSALPNEQEQRTKGRDNV